MLSHGFSSEPTAAENSVLDEVSRVLTEHLEHWRTRRREGDRSATSPVLLQIDGPGRSLFLERVASKLDDDVGEDRWSVIRFDAWQYQRVAPPWWWLIKAIDEQLRRRIERLERRRGLWRWYRRDWGWRLKLLRGDLVLAIPALVVAAALAAVAWLVSGAKGPVEILQWVVTAAAALTAVIGLGSSVINAIRRHLLVASPAGAKAVLQTSDPMAELMERYRFLVGAAESDVAILIDNLDRCRGDYVVELLEGIQTLFRNEVNDTDDPMVLYIVAADRGWLCDSYLTVYNEFKESMQEPGRPFGQKFLDKVFDFSLRIPTVPAATSLAADLASEHGIEEKAAEIMRAPREMDVRERLYELERQDAPPGREVGPPNQELRRRAVRRLAELEYVTASRFCPDTEQVLREVAALTEPGPAIVRHLAASYCVQRTALLLGGHEFDADDGAIQRLGLWTILGLRWPLLAAELALRPKGIDTLAAGHPADGAPADMAPVYDLPEARRFGELAADAGLDAAAVARYTMPMDVLSAATQPLSAGRFARAPVKR